MGEEQLRRQQIENIQLTNWNTLLQWQRQTGAYQTLDIPEGVAQVLIPTRILELSDDPSAVRVLINRNREDQGHTHDNLPFFIYERKQESISDPRVFEEWMQEYGRKIATPKPDEIPEGIDHNHIRHRGILQQGRLTLNDKIYLNFTVRKFDEEYPYLVKTGMLWDREDMHGMGVGTSFYNRFEEVLKTLGFEYLGGQIISHNPQFFSKRRIPLSQLPHEHRQRLPDLRVKGWDLPNVEPSIKVL